VVKIYHSPLISETAVGQKAKAPLIKKKVDHEGRAKGGRSMLRPYFVFRTTIVESFRGSRKFSAVGFFARGACCPALHPSFVCHSD
jgi:hypothetical protein